MSYEQKHPAFNLEMNPELDLLKIRVREIIDFTEKNIETDSSNQDLANLFEREEEWRNNLIEIKNLLENSTVKQNMVDSSDYSDIVGNFYGFVFLYLQTLASGKKLENRDDLLEKIKTKTGNFLIYLEGLKEVGEKEEPLAA